MLVYLVQVRTFTTGLLNGLETFNEVVVLITGYCLLLISDVNSNAHFRLQAGLFYIVVVLLCILGNWGVLLYKIISTIVDKIR